MEKKKKSKKAKIRYGKKDLLGNWEFDPSAAKVLISIRLDGDVLEEVKRRAAQDKEKYQPWINKKLRELVLPEPKQQVVGMTDFTVILKELEDLAIRVDDLEHEKKAVG